jgi:hypothetical protein
VKKAMAETLAVAQSQRKRKTQRRCGYEVSPASASRTGPAGLRQTWKEDILKFADSNTDGFIALIIMKSDLISPSPCLPDRQALESPPG